MKNAKIIFSSTILLFLFSCSKESTSTDSSPIPQSSEITIQERSPITTMDEFTSRFDSTNWGNFPEAIQMLTEWTVWSKQYEKSPIVILEYTVNKRDRVKFNLDTILNAADIGVQKPKTGYKAQNCEDSNGKNWAYCCHVGYGLFGNTPSVKDALNCASAANALDCISARIETADDGWHVYFERCS